MFDCPIDTVLLKAVRLYVEDLVQKNEILSIQQSLEYFRSFFSAELFSDDHLIKYISAEALSQGVVIHFDNVSTIELTSLSSTIEAA